MTRVVLGVIVLFLTLTVSEAITCYSCTTLEEGRKCNDDNFNKSAVDTEECTATGACSKIKGDNSTSRGCTEIFMDEGCNKTKEGVLECVCKVERCNGVTVKFFSKTKKEDSGSNFTTVIAVLVVVPIVISMAVILIIVCLIRRR